MDVTGYDLYQQTAFHTFRFGGFTFITLMIGLAAFIRKEKFDRWFAIMTFVWGSIHILLFFLLMGHIHVPVSEKVPETLEHVRYWISLNSGLDVFFVIMGLLMLLRAKRSRKYPLLWRGFGWAVIVQGSGLLILDLWFLSLLYA